MGKRSRRRGQSAKEPLATTDYADAEGNAITVRDSLSAGTLRELEKLSASPAASQEDRWQRRGELLFGRLVVGWTIDGLALEGWRGAPPPCRERAGRGWPAATGWPTPARAAGCARRSSATSPSAIPTP